jgi:hypothetical protein
MVNEIEVLPVPVSVPDGPLSLSVICSGSFS